MSETRFLKMDLRIEEQLWHDFHPNMIVSIQSWLMPQLLPKYAAQIEERVYVEHTEPVTARQVFRPGVVIHTETAGKGRAQASRAAVAEPVILTLPTPTEQRERYIAIVSLPGRDLVTVIELLSTANKRAGADGRRKYLREREQILMWIGYAYQSVAFSHILVLAGTLEARLAQSTNNTNRRAKARKKRQAVRIPPLPRPLPP